MSSRRTQLIILIILIPFALVVAAAATATLWFFSSPQNLTQQKAISQLAGAALHILVLAAVAGFAAMATLEMMKRLLRLRGRFLYRRVPSPEFLQQSDAAGDFPGKSGRSESSRLAYYSTVGYQYQRFDLPLEQLVAQLGYAAQRAVTELSGPPANQSLPLPPEDTDRLLSLRTSAFSSLITPVLESHEFDRLFGSHVDRLFGNRRNDARVARERAEFIDRFRAIENNGELPPEVGGATQRELLAYLYLRGFLGLAALAQSPAGAARLRVEAQVALDDFQVSVGNAWRLRLWLASSALAAAFGLGVLFYVPVPPGTKTVALVGTFLIGGFFASFFRDIAAIAERLRRLT